MACTLLMSSWDDGLFIVSGDGVRQEQAACSLKALASDGQGGALVIIDDHALCRRASDGRWSTLVATQETALACCVRVGEIVYVGTDDARILSLDAGGTLRPLPGFAQVAGRDAWYAGAAVVEGRLVGPPLGVRSIDATADGRVLLANVHVGGIPRSTDGGASWQPSIDIETDVHEVRAHPQRPDVVAAATAVGLALSHDGGASWHIEARGLHATHGSAVAFLGDDVLVSAARDPFDSRGAVYRRHVDEGGPLAPVGGGLPAWLEGGVDTACIASKGVLAAIADRRGNLYLSHDQGLQWSCVATRLGHASSLLIV